MFGRIEIQANDGFQLFGEVRIVADFEALDTMRFKSMRAPNTSHAGFANAHLGRHGARGPVGGIDRIGLCGLGNHGVDDRSRNRWLASGPRRIFQKTDDACLHETVPPQGCHASADIKLLGDLLVLQTISSQQNDATAHGYTNSNRTPTSLSLQLLATPLIQRNLLCNTHTKSSSS